MQFSRIQYSHSVVQLPPPSILNTFSSLPKWNSMPISSYSTFLLPPSLRKLLFCHLSLWVYLFWIFQINGIIHYVTFCIGLLSRSMMFSRFTHAVACKYFILFHGWILWMHHSVYPFISRWVFGRLSFFHLNLDYSWSLPLGCCIVQLQKAMVTLYSVWIVPPPP